ncbi:hypothetical protein Bhyg_13891, partial [Pseudolycoriella hygida]
TFDNDIDERASSSSDSSFLESWVKIESDILYPGSTSHSDNDSGGVDDVDIAECLMFLDKQLVGKDLLGDLDIDPRYGNGSDMSDVSILSFCLSPCESSCDSPLGSACEKSCENLYKNTCSENSYENACENSCQNTCQNSCENSRENSFETDPQAPNETLGTDTNDNQLFILLLSFSAIMYTLTIAFFFSEVQGQLKEQVSHLKNDISRLRMQVSQMDELLRNFNDHHNHPYEAHAESGKTNDVNDAMANNPQCILDSDLHSIICRTFNAKKEWSDEKVVEDFGKLDLKWTKVYESKLNGNWYPEMMKNRAELRNKYRPKRKVNWYITRANGREKIRGKYEKRKKSKKF